MQEYRKTIAAPPDDGTYHYVEMGGDGGGYSRHAFPTLTAATLFAVNHQQMRPERTILVDGKLLGTDVAHTIEVGWVPNNHGYPYRATCSCGWQSATYAATHAAEAMGEHHLTAAVLVGEVSGS